MIEHLCSIILCGERVLSFGWQEHGLRWRLLFTLRPSDVEHSAWRCQRLCMLHSSCADFKFPSSSCVQALFLFASMRWVISSEILAVHAPVHQQVPVARVVNPLCTPHPQGRWVCAVFFFLCSSGDPPCARVWQS